MNPPPVKYLPGGDHFHRMRFDVGDAIRNQTPWLASVPKHTVRRSRLINWFLLFIVVLLQRSGAWLRLVDAGFVRSWFQEFDEYWRMALAGREMTLPEFHNLKFLFRMRFSGEGSEQPAYTWETPSEHMANWQHPVTISNMVQFVYRQAHHPIRSRHLFSILKPGMRVLEYGCSTAPVYRTWRKFLNHVPSKWVLADISNHSFHFARHTLARDLEASFHVIEEENFSDPLKGCAGEFDLIIIHEVFEHLDDPLHIAKYLMDRLKTGGLFYFNYIRSDGFGLDTPVAARDRHATLEFLARNLKIIAGKFEVGEETVFNCVGRKIQG